MEFSCPQNVFKLKWIYIQVGETLPLALAELFRSNQK